MNSRACEILKSTLCYSAQGLADTFKELNIVQKPLPDHEPIIKNAKSPEDASWVYSIFGCFKPMLNIIGKGSPEGVKNLQSKREYRIYFVVS